MPGWNGPFAIHSGPAGWPLGGILGRVLAWAKLRGAFGQNGRTEGLSQGSSAFISALISK